jgi:iron complex outermembrane receptor protein
VDYSFEYHRWRQSVPAFQATYAYPGSPVAGLYGPAFDLRPYVQTNRVDSTPSNATYGADFPRLHRLADDGNERMHILTGAWDLGEVGPLGNVTVKSLSSYRSMVYNGSQELDGSPLHLAENHPTHDVQHWSEELQWVGTAPRVHYVAGFYYYGEYAMQSNDFVAFGGGANVYYKNLQNLQSYAPYGQLTWTPPILSDKLSLTAGIRYTQEQVHLEHFNQDLANPASPANWSGAHGKAFGIHGSGAPGLSPMGDISYQWRDDVMTYFRISRGFKGGGFNDSAGDPVSFSIPFEPERLLQYEAGFKTQWFDRRLRLNAAGFYSDYNDLQVSAFRFSPGYGPVNSYTNAANAEIWGMEFEGTAIPLRGLEATVGYSFLAPKYLKWLDQKFDANNLPIFDANGNPVYEDVKDKRSFAFCPKNQLTAALTYTASPTQSGTFSAHVDVYWQDRVTFITNNDTAGAQANEGWAYALVNGRLQFAGIPLQKGSLDLALWGRNLFDRKYRTYGIDFGAGLGLAGNNYGDPRTFGVGLTYNFTAGEAAVPPPPPAPLAQAVAPPPPAKKKIVLRSVHFDFDKATLKADATPLLEEAVRVLKQEGSVDIVVEGHTDSVGTDEYNLGLSRRRAETVRRYLVAHGVASSRITAEGLGESKPVASNETADGRAQNRRVELHVK